MTTLHPIGGREVGWEQVKGPWERIAAIASGGEVALNDRLVRTSGDMAYEIGVEKGHLALGGSRVAFEHRVTNVHRKEAGGWRIVHHHTDVSPPMVDALQRLQAKT